jgi:hypothetical protein
MLEEKRPKKLRNVKCQDLEMVKKKRKWKGNGGPKTFLETGRKLCNGIGHMLKTLT